MEVIKPQEGLSTFYDSKIDIPILPVGLLIGNDKLGNITVVERPTAVPSSRTPSISGGSESSSSPRQLSLVSVEELEETAQSLEKEELRITAPPKEEHGDDKDEGIEKEDIPCELEEIKEDKKDKVILESHSDPIKNTNEVLEDTPKPSPKHVKTSKSSSPMQHPKSPIKISRRGSSDSQQSSSSSSSFKSNKNSSPREKPSRDSQKKQGVMQERKSAQKGAQRTRSVAKDRSLKNDRMKYCKLDLENKVEKNLSQTTRIDTLSDTTDNSKICNDELFHKLNCDASLSVETGITSVHQLQTKRLELLLNIENIDRKLENMKHQKIALLELASHVIGSSHEAFELKRNNQGVPFVNAVKELIKKRYDNFHYHRDNIESYKKALPFYAELQAIFKTFNQVCERIILTTVNYNVTYLEDFHLMAGKICGMIQSTIQLYFDDIIKDEPNEENIEPNQNAVNQQQHSTANKSSHSPTETLLNKYASAGPDIFLNEQGVDDDLLKGLEAIGEILSRANECLANITRLSLGNPKSQSLSDTFVAVSITLKESDLLLIDFEKLNLPCVGILKKALKNATTIANVSKPGEKQVEQLKYYLGECDGELFIIAKYIFN